MVLLLYYLVSEVDVHVRSVRATDTVATEEMKQKNRRRKDK